jgi:hypothetical protein
MKIIINETKSIKRKEGGLREGMRREGRPKHIWTHFLYVQANSHFEIYNIYFRLQHS